MNAIKKGGGKDRDEGEHSSAVIISMCMLLFFVLMFVISNFITSETCGNKTLQVSEYLLSAVSDFQLNLLARDSNKTVADLEALYNAVRFNIVPGELSCSPTLLWCI